MILCVSTISCVTNNRPPTLIEGKDGGDLANGCPAVLEGKMWMTVDYAQRYYMWKNHK